MSSVEVAALVDAILSAFASGLGLFRRMRAKQRPKKSKKRPEQILMTEDEWQLQDSLQRRPKDIRNAYDRSHAWLGRRFAVGDAAAHTSLNQVLLILNTGLADILRTALADDIKSLVPSRRSLLELSERAAASAVLALDGLRTRLSPQPQLSLPAPVVKVKDRQADHSSRVVDKAKSRPGTRPRSKSFSGSETRRPGPDPLKRGAWIRSKTERSMFSNLDPSSSYIIPRANPGKTKSKSNIKIWPGYVQTSPKSTSPRSSHHRTKSSPACPSHPQSRPPLNDLPDSPRPPSYHSTTANQHSPRSPRRQPSLLLASPAVFNDFPAPQTAPQAPLRPPKIPLQYVSHHPRLTVDQPLAFRPRPPSVATFMTASTKIGEIPEHRWSSADREGRGESGHVSSPRPPLPCILAAPMEEPFAKRKGWGFRFWKRDRERERAIDVL